MRSDGGEGPPGSGFFRRKTAAERGFFELIIDTGLRPNDFVAYTGENLLSAFSIDNSDAYQVFCFAPLAAGPPMYLL